jgi:hypothetical protein
MIFPGMDPYLEYPQLWEGFHNALLTYIRNYLRPLLRPRYIAAVEGRVFLEVPALEMHEAYLTILDRASGQRIVTLIEVVSPTNKSAGSGRESYKAKQQEVLASDVHLVEIDLLRKGPHVLAIPESTARRRAGDYDYLSCVNRALGVRNRYELYPAQLRNKLPRILIPLADGDPDVKLELQTVLAQNYDDGSYRDRIDYSKPCEPRLRPEDQAWADELIRQAGATPNP